MKNLCLQLNNPDEKMRGVCQLKQFKSTDSNNSPRQKRTAYGSYYQYIHSPTYNYNNKFFICEPTLKSNIETKVNNITVNGRPKIQSEIKVNFKKQDFVDLFPEIKLPEDYFENIDSFELCADKVAYYNQMINYNPRYIGKYIVYNKRTKKCNFYKDVDGKKFKYVKEIGRGYFTEKSKLIFWAHNNQWKVYDNPRECRDNNNNEHCKNNASSYFRNIKYDCEDHIKNERGNRYASIKKDCTYENNDYENYSLNKTDRIIRNPFLNKDERQYKESGTGFNTVYPSYSIKLDSNSKFEQNIKNNRVNNNLQHHPHFISGIIDPYYYKNCPKTIENPKYICSNNKKNTIICICVERIVVKIVS